MEPLSIISFFIAFIIGITIHESAHAWMGNKLGDPTAKELGRISLNPIRHIDPIGSILLPLIGLLSPAHSLLGWAKPTPYNPANLKDLKKDEILISIAGPISNILLAGFCVALFYLVLISTSFLGGLFDANDFFSKIFDLFGDFLYYLIVGNLLLAFFNLLPIPPLDGASFLKIILPQKFSYHLEFLNQYGFLILMMASFTPLGNILGTYLDICIGLCLKIVGFV